VGNFPRHRDYELGPYRERPNTIMCSGNLSAIRAFPELVAALRLLPRELDVRLLAMGQLRNGAKRAQPGWERVDHVPWQPFPEVIRGMLRARIGVALLRPLPNHMDAIRSNKLFEYMAAGLPVVVSDLPEWRDIVLGVGCGLVVDPADPAAIAEALERLLTHPEEAEEMGLRGRAAVCDRFNWDGEGARLLSAYRRLLGEPAPRPEPEPEPARAPEPEPVAAK
jgi:glycosyltransferase involved in cell wall biosynthesis